MQPKVSVLTCCYNQEETIIRTIESVIEQKVNFEIEYVIVDDGSADNSLYRIVEIFVRCLDRFFACIYNNKHKGLMETYKFGLSKCTGEYIAFCDGDDYWVDPFKLAKQVAYMDSHPECGVCITRVYKETNGVRTTEPITTKEINKKLSYDSLLRGTIPIHAQSYLIRKSVLDKYVNFQEYIDLGFNTWDLPIVLELSKHTEFKCLNFWSAVFVKNTESVTNTESRMRRFDYLLGTYWIKYNCMITYGCKSSTFFYLIYKVLRDLYSIGFKRWNG